MSQYLEQLRDISSPRCRLGHHTYFSVALSRNAGSGTNFGQGLEDVSLRYTCLHPGVVADETPLSPSPLRSWKFAQRSVDETELTEYLSGTAIRYLNDKP
jgi:hypothetical protein